MDFMNLRQHRTDITDYYKKFTDMKNLVDEMVGKDEGTYFMGGMIGIICREEEVDRGNIDSATEAEYMV